jgi:regulator of sigma E protease
VGAVTTSILAFIFVLGVLIFVHELGHFIMARRIGVRVLTFSLGFGPKLLAFRRGDTEYCISAIPLGGYVKMAGENPEDSRTGASDEFLSKTKWQRFQVLVMGPVMNIALAVIVMAAVLYQGALVPAYEDRPAYIGIFAKDSIAEKAGVELGDLVVSVDGREVPTWNQFALMIATKANRSVRLGIQRDGQAIEKMVVPASIDRYDTGAIGVGPVVHPQVSDAVAGQPAAEAGLVKGDVIVGAAGETNVSGDRLVELIKAHADKPLILDVRRDSVSRQVPVQPRLIDGTVKIGTSLSSEAKFVNPGVFEALKLSVERNYEMSTLIFETLGGLFTRDTSVKQLMGPVAIASISGEAARQPGWIPLFSLMAMISLNLGLVNLLPIPVLDGGHIAILALEGVSRRDFSMRVKEKMLLAGFVLLLMLMATVIYNDLMRIQWIEQLVPWRS